MTRLLSALVLVVIFALFPASMLAAPGPEFALGFKALAEQIPGTVGQPLENEHYGPNGDSLQRTTTGLMVWRKRDNWTAFTDGNATWLSSPEGTVRSRSNTERFLWETDAPARDGVAPLPVPPEVQAWARGFEDQKLRDALALAYGYALDWRPVATAVARKDIPVRWSPLSDDRGAAYDYEIWQYSNGQVEIHNGSISVNSSLRTEPLPVVAAILAHEAVHAATIDGSLDPAGCYQQELTAYSYEAYVWQQMPRPAKPSTDRERGLVSLVQRWQEGKLTQAIEELNGYEEQCSRLAR